MTNRIAIAPSILAADFAYLADSIAVIAGDIDMLHVDVMDGHFVPNISLGPPVIRSLRGATDLYLDCHLMITDPLRYLGTLKEAGADGVTVHIEAVPDPRPVAMEAGDLGLDFGLVVNPSTPVTSIDPYLDLCSMVVVMSVEPGFGGQHFIDAVLPKIRSLRESVDSRALPADIQVDGGINLQTAGQARSAGANVFVAGSSVFGADDPLSTVQELRSIVGAES
ncbi:Ribulose-phosphate 3-epimerase [hydrothermal vent metagenome]|uniref:ribulose-phosphate 3-epimerase n=1 Tax=hydrothermal vent metagenome TaxID=652676 RepID=A0A3B0SA57_9ZZZZ